MTDPFVVSSKTGNRPAWILGTICAAAALLALLFAFSGAAAFEFEDLGIEPRALDRLIHADGDGLRFVLELPSASFVAGDDLQISGLDERTSVAGLPALPFYSTYIVLPPESNPRVTIERTAKAFEKNLYLPSVPDEVVVIGALFAADFPEGQADPLSGELPGRQYASPAAEPRSSSGSPAIAQDGYFPSEIVTISKPMMVRDVRLARLTIYPIRYDTEHQLLSVTPEIEVAVDFQRAWPARARQSAPSYGDQHIAAIAGSVINPSQLQEFRSLPASLQDSAAVGAAVGLPLGQDLYKIAVTDPGIKQLTYEALGDAGMIVDSVDPATLKMMYRGETVATEFVGDTDNIFEPGESIRFFGQPFGGSRLERQFISKNIYWVWSGDQATPIETKASVSGEPVTTFLESLTVEPESVYFQGFTAYWPENEPDAWYWDWWTLNKTPVTRTFTVTLPSPAHEGPAAQFTVEFSSRDSHIGDQRHNVAVSMNEYSSVASRSWWGESNFNVIATVPHSNVIEGANNFVVTAVTSGTWANLALNRITVDYQRSLQAVENQLLFGEQQNGSRQYHVRGFNQPSRDIYMAWDVTDPLLPTAIDASTIAVTGSGPYTASFGIANTGNGRYIVTTADHVLSPASIERYVAPSLDAPEGADWIAIAHRDFVTETMRLAAHRSRPEFGGLITHVVDVEHIINQYGYGLPLPAAIQSYLAHAMTTWAVKPSYVTLVGDTTLDPRRIRDVWTDQQYVPTDLVFVDRYNGHIPSDLTYGLVSGSDLLPDLSVGRIAIQSVAELENAIDKIVRYDENRLFSFGWMENMLFVSDQSDPAAGDFCYQNQLLSERLPPSMNSEILCLDDYDNGTALDGDKMREDIFNRLETTGATMLTYRGHGAIAYWGGNPVILSRPQAEELENQQPFVVLSGDCLDGHFAYPPTEGLGEGLIQGTAAAAGSFGAAAHWGSSGLGLSSDHTDILNGFYDGLFAAGATALGDASNYAKLVYSLDPWNDQALMYSFNLQGDPAMHLLRPSIELQAEWQFGHAKRDSKATLTLTVLNHGHYPSHIELVGDSIADFTVTGTSSTVSHSTTFAGDGVQITLQFGDGTNAGGIPRGEQATVSLEFDVAADAALGPRVARFRSDASGLEAWPGDEAIVEEISVVQDAVWLPMMRR